MSFSAPPGSVGGPPGPGIPGMNPNLDPTTIVPKIYPILAFRDNVVRSISAIISKIPGLEKLIETITERVTLFVLSLLAPFIQPIIAAATKQLKEGSSAVVDSSANHQYEPWTDAHCTDPTHSLLSKDHFSNILNEPAGQVAAAILQYVAPRIVYAWDHPDVPVDQVLNDVVRVFHHPAIRDSNCEVHRNMFDVVKRWVDGRSDRGRSLDTILSSESVRAGKNHSGDNDHSHGQGQHGHSAHQTSAAHGGQSHGGQPHGQQSGFPNLNNVNIPGVGNLGKLSSKPFSLLNPNRPRDLDFESTDPYARGPSPQPSPGWGTFQPYESQYAGGVPPESYAYQAAHGGAYDHGQSYGTGSGGDNAYTVPTAYQQGYEPYGEPHQTHQPPPQGGHEQWGSGYGSGPYSQY